MFLIGGGGRDTLIGGLGADRFDFNTLTDSPSINVADQILDFQESVTGEQIDLADVFGGTLSFVATQNSGAVNRR